MKFLNVLLHRGPELYHFYVAQLRCGAKIDAVPAQALNQFTRGQDFQNV
jgi:hypothetical protein